MKVLVVEDESIIRKGIVTTFDWHAYGIDQVEEAKNGKEALGIVPSLQPDIVITDIRMPEMDGLALAKELRHIYPSIYIVLLSGYQDFEYAQQAIHLGIAEYLLKPIGLEELGQVMMRLRSKIEQDASISAEWNKLNTIYQHNSDVIAEEWLNNIVDEQYILTEQQMRYGEQIGVKLTGPYYQLLVIEIDDYDWVTKMKTNVDIEKVYDSVDQKLCANLPLYWDFVIWKRASGHMIVVMNLYKDNKDFTKDYIHNTHNDVEKKEDYTITIGMSEIIDHFSKLPNAYQQAKRALSKKRHFGKNSVYNAEVIVGKPPTLTMSKNDEDKLLKGVRQLNFKQVKETLRNYFSFYRSNQMPLELVKNWCMQFIFTIKKDIRISHSLNQENNLFSQIETYDNLNDVEQFMKSEIISVMNLIEVYRQEEESSISSRAIRYMETHYHEQITLEVMAKYTFVSSAHFSKVFKKETDITFVEWLNNYRINQAKFLFKTHTALPVYKVGELVGLPNYKYFTRVFKKYFGITPSEYKASSLVK